MVGLAYPSEQEWVYPLESLLALPWVCWLGSVWVSQQARVMASVWEHYHRRCHEQYYKHRGNQVRSPRHNLLWPDNTG